MSGEMVAAHANRESLQRAVRNFPAAPMILARLERLLADYNSPLEDITALLKCDAALTTRILRIANSSVYNVGEPCASLEEAVLRVGFREIYRLTGFAATVQIVEQRLALYRISSAQFRENALLTALIMEELAGHADLDRAAAYTVGLLRSIGKIALDRWAWTPGRELRYEPIADEPLAIWEIARVGMDNCEAAEIVMRDWLFPASTIDAIRQHYAPAEATRLGQLLNVAAGAAERCGHGWPGERSYWDDSPERCAMAGLLPHDVEDAMHLAYERFGPVRTAVA